MCQVTRVYHGSCAHFSRYELISECVYSWNYAYSMCSFGDNRVAQTSYNQSAKLCNICYLAEESAIFAQRYDRETEEREVRKLRRWAGF